VTSRAPLAALEDVYRVQVPPLSEDQAVALLGHLVGVERLQAEPQTAAAIVRLCEYLPLALRMAGGRLAARPHWPLAEMRDRLADEHGRLDQLEIDGVGFRTSVAGTYERLSGSSDRLERTAAEAFGRLGAVGQSMLSRSVASRLLAQPEVNAERALERLVDAQLLETGSPGTYRMGDLLRLYARERFADQQDWAAVRPDPPPGTAAGPLRESRPLGRCPAQPPRPRSV